MATQDFTDHQGPCIAPTSAANLSTSRQRVNHGSLADARTIGTLMLWIEEARRMADRLAWYAEAFPALKTLCEEFGIEHNSAQWTPEESDALAWLITQQQHCLLEVVHPEVH